MNPLEKRDKAEKTSTPSKDLDAVDGQGDMSVVTPLAPATAGSAPSGAPDRTLMWLIALGSFGGVVNAVCKVVELVKG